MSHLVRERQLFFGYLLAAKSTSRGWTALFLFLYPLPRSLNRLVMEPEPKSWQNLALQNLVENKIQATIRATLGSNKFAISKVSPNLDFSQY